MIDEIEHLSASGIKQFRKCGKQFHYKYLSDVESPEEGEIEHFEVGNAVHDTLEESLQEDGVLDLPQEELLDRFREKELSLGYNYDDTDKVQTSLETASKFISKYVTDIVSVEDKFEMTVNGIDFVGYADLVADIEIDGEVYSDVVIDWKTGKVNDEWKEKVQGGMYVRMFYEEYGRWPESIQFVYLNEETRSSHNRISDGEVLWNNHQNKYWEEIEKDISQISNAAFKGEWEANVTDDCYWCDFKFACSDYIGSEEVEPHHIKIGPM